MEKYIETTDNIKIAINHFEGQNSDEVMIIAPGFFMTKDTKPFYNMSMEFFKKYDVITMDFRGHGKSKGFFTFTSKEILDMKAVVEFARKSYKKIYLLGFSLGGAVVVLHATLEQNVDKVIAVSAPAEFGAIEYQFWHPAAFVPTIKKMDLRCWFSIRPSIIPHKKLKPVDLVKAITVPALFIAGDNDHTVFEWHTKLLYEKANCPKKYVLFEKANHAEDLFIDYKEKFLNICFEWLESALE